MIRFIKFLTLGAIGLAQAAHAQLPVSSYAHSYSDRAWLPASPTGAAPLFFASTDPKNKNEDYITLKPNETRRVPLAAGSIVRLWSTALEPDKIELDVESSLVTRKTSAPRLLSRSKAALGATYENKTFLWYPSFGDVSPAWTTLGRNAALVVRNLSDKPNKWFYQVTLRPVQSTVEIDRTSPKIAALPVPPTQAASARGDGKITVSATKAAYMVGLTVRFASKPDNAVLQKARLKIVLQPKSAGAPTELVNVPLGPLVGAFHSGASPLRDLFTSWSGQELYLSWPMPFDGAKERLQIEVSGAPATLEASVSDLPAANPYRFHAAYGSGRSVKKQAMPILRATGEGAFVGLRLAIAPAADTTRRTFSYLEGNETLVADGKTYEGTGTEDYFNSAWYFPDKPFARAYGGLSEKTALPPRVSMYRLMVPDSVPFKRDFRFDFEVGNGNNADDLEFRWVAFWYQKQGGTAQIGDTLGNGAAASGENALASQSDGVTPNGVGPNRVRSIPDLPVWVEVPLGLVLFGAVVMALASLFRHKKVKRKDL